MKRLGCYQRKPSLGQRDLLGRLTLERKSISLFFPINKNKQTNSYERCIEEFTQALAVNPLSHKSCYVQGCAAMQIGRWNDALNSFSRVVSLDPEDGESWSNIAAVNMQVLYFSTILN